MPGNLLCMEEKWPKGQHRFLMVPPRLVEDPNERALGGWGQGGSTQRRAGERGSGTVRDDFCPEASAMEGTVDDRLQKTTSARDHTGGRPTVWPPADRGQSSHRHLHMPPVHQQEVGAEPGKRHCPLETNRAQSGIVTI